MVNEHVFMNIVPLTKIQPLLIFKFGKVVCVLGISTTSTKHDNQCSDHGPKPTSL